MGVSNAPWGVVEANCLLILKDGVGLLTAGGGPSGGISCRGAGDVVGARRLTLSGGLLSLGLGSLGGGGRVWLVGRLLPSLRDGPDPKGGALFLRPYSSSTPLELV